MKLRFLGTAAATAFPLMFCRCDVCKKARELKGPDDKESYTSSVHTEMQRIGHKYGYEIAYDGMEIEV